MFQSIVLRGMLPVLLLTGAYGVMAGPDKPSSAPVHLGNPIRPLDTPDPGVVRANGKWYVYHTNSIGEKGRYPIVVSDDLSDWKVVGYVFEKENMPEWCSQSRSWWAPEVHKVNNTYIAYYTARQNDSNRFAVGAAVASSPEGPFKDIGAPIKTNDGVGLIDVNYFEDPTTRKKYLLWKEDQNDFNPPRPTPIMMQELSSDGLKVIGNPRELIRNDQPWEGVLVEAPTLIHRDGWYYLFYSGNIFVADEYSVGVARSKDIWGPYEKDPKPILVHDATFSGPAHQFVIQDEAGRWHIFYHARIKQLTESRRRYLMHDYLTFTKDGWPRVNNGHPGLPSETTIKQASEIHSRARRTGEEN